MKKFLLLVLPFIHNISYSQDHKIILTGTFENVRHILSCPSFSYSFNNSEINDSLDILNDNSIELVMDEYIKVSSTVKDYVLSKTSTYFQDNLEFYSLEIVRPDRLDDFANRVPKVDSSRCHIKYSINYYFVPIIGLKYCVGFALDKNLNIITPDNFPSGEIPPFEETTILQLETLASTYLNKKVEDLELAVIENKFFWRFKESINYEQGKNIVKEISIDASNLKSYSIKESEIYVDIDVHEIQLN